MFHQARRILRPIAHFHTDNERIKKISFEVNQRFPDLVNEFSANQVVIDLGANRGDFSVWAANHGCKVLAIEPDKTAFNYLIRRIKKFRNIYALNVGVYNQNAFIPLYHHSSRSKDPLGHSISSSINPSKKNVSVNYSEEIFVFKLESILDNLNVFILKIDIEGGEIQLLDTIMKHASKIEYLLMETHEHQLEYNYSMMQDFIEKNNLSHKWKLDWI